MPARGPSAAPEGEFDLPAGETHPAPCETANGGIPGSVPNPDRNASKKLSSKKRTAREKFAPAPGSGARCAAHGKRCRSRHHPARVPPPRSQTFPRERADSLRSARVRTPLSRNRGHWLTDAWAAYQVLRLGAVFGHCIRFRWFDPVLGGETVDQPGQVGIIGDLGHEPLP